MGLWTKLLRKNRNKPVVELRPLTYWIYNEHYSNDFIKDEWIKANPNAFKTKKWEELKNMSKKEMRNVGFKKNVMVPVDVKTNLASIDAAELHKLYKERDIAVEDSEGYLRRASEVLIEKNKLVDVNNSYIKRNEILQETNDKLIEENERLKSKITILQDGESAANAFAKATESANAFAKAAESLAKFVKAGKPTYDQLLEENEKHKDENRRLIKENKQLKENNKYLDNECDALDKECDALVDEKEKLQAEVDSLKTQIDGFDKRNSELINELVTCKNELKTMTIMANYYRKCYFEQIRRSI